MFATSEPGCFTTLNVMGVTLLSKAMGFIYYKALDLRLGRVDSETHERISAPPIMIMGKIQVTG